MPTLSSSEKSAHAKNALSLKCLAVREDLHAYVDGEVSGAPEAKVVMHVSSCPSCQQEEASLRRLLATVRQSQLPVLASRRLRLRVAQLFAAEI